MNRCHVTGSPMFGDSDPAGTPDRRSPFRRSSQPTRTSEDLRSHHGRGQEIRAQPKSLDATSGEYVISSGRARRDIDRVIVAHFNEFAPARKALVERIRSTAADEHIEA
jgi:hypothetical protein